MTYKGYLQWPAPQELENLINKHGSFTGAAKEFGCDAESMRLKAKKLKLNVKVRPHRYNKINWPNDEELIRMINRLGSYTLVANQLGCHDESIRLRSIQRNYPVILTKEYYECNSKIFTDENALSYYLLGAYMSDGNVEKNTNRIGIISKDKEWVESIRNLISPDSPLQTSNEGRAFIFRFSSKEVRDWLIKNECVPCKSLICKMPNVPKQYFRDFVRGIFDGDGSISCKLELGQDGITRSKMLTAYICSASEEFLFSMKKEFEFQNIFCIYSKNKMNKSFINGNEIHRNSPFLYKITFNSGNAYHFLKWIYYPDHKIHLERKYLKALEIFNFYESEDIIHNHGFRSSSNQLFLKKEKKLRLL